MWRRVFGGGVSVFSKVLITYIWGIAKYKIKVFLSMMIIVELKKITVNHCNVVIVHVPTCYFVGFVRFNFYCRYRIKWDAFIQ